MKTRFSLLLTLLFVLTAPLAAQAQQLFDFLGNAALPVNPGGTLTLHSIVHDAAPAVTPLALDFDNFEYTLVIEGLVLDADGPPQTYSGGTIALYEDAGTAAVYGAGGTFTDGTLLLSGTFTVLTRTLFTATLGSTSGSVDWTGGTRLNEIAVADQDSWSFFAAINRNGAEAGYDERWDGKVEPVTPIVETETRSWGAVKQTY